MKSNVLDSFKRMSAKEKRFLVATFSMYGSSYYLLNPTIPIFVADFAAEQTWIVTGAFGGGVVLALPVASYLIDRYGSWVVSWVMACFTVITITVFSLVTNIEGIITVQMFRGLLFGISISAADSMLNRLVAKDERAKAFGRMYSTSTVSLMLLSKPGIDLAEKDHFPLLWTVGVILAVATVGFFLSIRVPREKSNRELRKRIVYSGVIPYGIAVMGVTCYCGVVFQYIQKYSSEEGFTGQGGYFLTVMAVSVLVFRHTVLGRFPSLTHQVVTISMVLLMVSGFLLWWGKGVIPFYLASVLVGVGYGVCIPSFPPLAYANVPDGRQGAAAATYNALSYGGPVLGLMAGGYLGENIGYRNMYLVITPILLVSLVVWGAMKRRVAVDSA